MGVPAFCDSFLQVNRKDSAATIFYLGGNGSDE
jgi:hypothetical protein